MSVLIGGNGTDIDAGIIQSNDARANPPWWKDRTGQQYESFDTDLIWPRSSFLGLGSDGVSTWIEGTSFEPWYPYGGTHTMYTFTGVTRDVNGSALPGCTVVLFRTSDNSVQDTTVSDSLGNYILHSPYSPDTHYIVAYLAGSPDVTGSTVNTLVGSA